MEPESAAESEFIELFAIPHSRHTHTFCQYVGCIGAMCNYLIHHDPFGHFWNDASLENVPNIHHLRIFAIIFRLVWDLGLGPGTRKLVAQLLKSITAGRMRLQHVSSPLPFGKVSNVVPSNITSVLSGVCQQSCRRQPTRLLPPPPRLSEETPTIHCTYFSA